MDPGMNVTEKVHFAPAANVDGLKGQVSLLMLKLPLPLVILILVMVSVLPPLVRVTVCAALVVP